MGKPFTSIYDVDDGEPTKGPTAPSYEEVSKNDLSYVDFIVYGDNENYSVRADKKSILESNTELAKMVKAEKYMIRDGNVNVNAFELMVRFIETKFIKFNGVKQALEVLDLATKYQCPDLEIACVKEIDLNLSVENVLEVLKAFWCYKGNKISVQITQPSKKLAPIVTSEEYLAAMLNNCLQMIDMNADVVLKQDPMENMRFEELEMIVKREHLQIKSEVTLFNLLAGWSIKECERKNLEKNEENRKRILGGLIYCPRYLTMSSNDFKACRERVELLDHGETQLIEDFLNGKKLSNTTPEQAELLESFKRPRPKFAQLPIYLSARSNPKNYPKNMRKAMKQKDDDRSCCDSCLVSCASVFACIFE